MTNTSSEPDRDDDSRMDPQEDTPSDPDQDETPDVPSERDDITVVWQGACELATHATQTIKGDQTTDTVQPLSLNIAIKERSIRSSVQEGLASSQTSDDYDILQVLGKGGMGIVFSARQSSVDRVVALKMLRGNSESVSRRELFLQEAVVTADLDHPNIVPVHELGTDADGSLFYSMKQVSGQAWNRVIRRKSLDENLEILMRVGDALAFAHSRGIVHRDLKPENVMLGRFGEVWLMDWGLALPTEGYAKPTLKTPPMGGTPAYMPPEMAIPDRSVGPWSDIYLLGATLFEIVTRRPPHAGPSVIACLRSAALNKIVSTHQDSGLLDIAYQAMATKPGDRFASVAEFQESVREWMDQSESLAITRNAQDRLDQAGETRDYEDFVRAIFGFEQAAELFPDNSDALVACQTARFQYAEVATENEDYDLAISQLDPNDLTHQSLLLRIGRAKADQQSRALRMKHQRVALRFLVGMTCLLLVSGILVAGLLRSSALELANTNDPAMHASMSLQSGMRRSLGSLRGWVALGDPRFKEDRKVAWNREIWPAVEELRHLASQSKHLADDPSLTELSSILDDLHEEQWWIEDVAQTPGNQPATDLLLRDIDPIETGISLTLQGMVESERQAEQAGERSQQWPKLTELQWNFSDGHRSLMHAIDDGSDVAGKRFHRDLTAVKSIVGQLSHAESPLGEDQRRSIDWMASEIAAYERLALDALELRDSEQANVAQWWLRTRAIPTAERADSLISEIVTRSRDATQNNSKQINQISLAAISVGVALFLGIMLAVALVVLRRFSRGRTAARIAALSIALTGGTAFLRADEAQKSAIEPADVYVTVERIIGELELIRHEMGKPQSGPLSAKVADASPHEVFFQALTMFQKTDELFFEQTRQRMTPPEKPEGKIEPADVLRVVNVVEEMLDTLKSELGIPDMVVEPERDPTKTATDVFIAISRANQQLNRLVERRFTPSNVYQQVTVAVSYASTLLASFPGSTRLPPEPAYERAKTPSDVYRRLLTCYQRIREIAATSGQTMIRYEIEEDAIANASPSDVYDIASLIVSELAHLHSVHGELKPPRRVYSPGRTFPSHVYQRAGMLEKQITQLEELVEQQPNWLSQ